MYRNLSPPVTASATGGLAILSELTKTSNPMLFPETGDDSEGPKHTPAERAGELAPRLPRCLHKVDESPQWRRYQAAARVV